MNVVQNKCRIIVPHAVSCIATEEVLVLKLDHIPITLDIHTVIRIAESKTPTPI